MLFVFTWSFQISELGDASIDAALKIRRFVMLFFIYCGLVQ
jgi:hypothetical protein